jgi:homoserine dehydrogenase
VSRRVINLGLAGFGTVGSALARIMVENADDVARRTTADLRIKTVLVRDPDKPRGFDPGPETTFTTRVEDILDDPEIDIVLELMGGLDNAEAFTRKALEAGKHVVTANKALLAERGRPLFELAARKNLGLYYEASIAGGIPIVQALKHSLAANRIDKLQGILNGTANFIMSEMTTKGMSFEEALAEATELGYAEADPTLDVDGIDAAHKLALLVRLCHGQHYPFEEMHIEGIRGVTPEDIRFAREFGYRIKLIGQIRQDGSRIDAGMFPALVRDRFLLSKLGKNLNGIRVMGNMVGPLFFTGQGAGGLPTASAVLADILMLVRRIDAPDNTGFIESDLPLAEVLPPEESVHEFYLRFTVADRPGVMAAIASVMAENDVSIAQAIQRDTGEGELVPLVFMTHTASTRAIARCLEATSAFDFIGAPTAMLRIIEEDA